MRHKKWEMAETRLRLKQRPFLIHFLCRTIGEAPSGKIQKQLQPDSPIFEEKILLKKGWLGVGVVLDVNPLGT